MMSKEHNLKNSENCYAQWGDIWDEHAKFAATYEQKDMSIFKSSGIGRVAVAIGNGYSFEENIETIKKYKNNIDVIVCDKALGHCLRNGIVPKFVTLSDCRVNAEKYLAPYLDQIKETYLLANVCSNPDWWVQDKWKGIYFHVNMDVLGLEKRYQELSGCPTLIPAATNVSNTSVVLLTQFANQRNPVNFMEYDKIILVGYDFSWKNNYYAFDQDGGGKSRYMQQTYMIDAAGRHVFSSPNLLHSAQWLEAYARAARLPIRMGSKRSIIQSLPFADLEKELGYNYRTDDFGKLKNLISLRQSLQAALEETGEAIDAIRFDHLQNIKRTARWA